MSWTSSTVGARWIDLAAMMLTTRARNSSTPVAGVRPKLAKHRVSARSMRLPSNGTIRPSRLTIVIGTVMSSVIVPFVALDPFVATLIAASPPFPVAGSFVADSWVAVGLSIQYTLHSVPSGPALPCHALVCHVGRLLFLDVPGAGW